MILQVAKRIANIRFDPSQGSEADYGRAILPDLCCLDTCYSVSRAARVYAVKEKLEQEFKALRKKNLFCP